MPCQRETVRKFGRSCLATLLLLLLAGCGSEPEIESERTAVQGTITYEGQPLPGGSITIVSVDNPKFRVTTMIRQDGMFRVADAPKGTVRIAVDTESLKYGAPAEDYVQIPAKYADPTTSGLTHEIVPDGPELTLELSQAANR